jgi:phage shock protein A
MSQHSIFGRITQLSRANVSVLIDEADDPQNLLDEMVREYTSAISDAESAVAATIASLRMLEEDAREDQAAAVQWQAKAAAASHKADDMRSAGDTVEADKFDNLARVALRKQIDHEDDARNLAAAIADQADAVERLRDGLTQMQVRLDDLRRKRDELVGKGLWPHAPVSAVHRIDLLDPASEISRFEERIRREEARIGGQEEVATSGLEVQFEETETNFSDAAVEARLAAMKSGQIP